MGDEYRQLAVLVMASQKHSRFFRVCLVAPLLTMVACAGAQARQGDTLQGFVSYTATYDSNIFRTASGEQSDIYHQLGAGLLLDWKESRQQVTGRVSASKTRFSDLSVLDYNGYDFQGQWNWQLGNHLSGQLGYTASRSLGSFVDSTVGLTQNTVDRSRKFVNGSYQFHPRWRINAAVDSDKLEYGADSQDDSDRTLDAAELGADYLTPKGSRLGMFVKVIDGKYPNRQVLPFPFTTVDNSFEQREIGLRTFWAYDGKLTFSGRAGQAQREHDEVPQRDFTGLTGRVDATWQATGKLRIGGAIYRDIGAVEDIYSSYSVNDGIRITPSWQISSKLALDAQAYVERRSFEGDPFSIGIHRQDDAHGYSLSLNYQPKTWASLGMSVQSGSRDSNLANDFSYRSVSLSAQLVF
jgi:exopolysaccharide biosynthesis operon protein EpsL